MLVVVDWLGVVPVAAGVVAGVVGLGPAIPVVVEEDENGDVFVVVVVVAVAGTAVVDPSEGRSMVALVALVVVDVDVDDNVPDAITQWRSVTVR
jgi:hypothetical protein